VSATEAPIVWAIVDLFGHAKTAGKVSEHALGGETFVRVDSPTDDLDRFHTTLYGKGAIYAIRFVDEAIARAYAQRCANEPVSAYDVRDLAKTLPRPVPEAPGFDDDRLS